MKLLPATLTLINSDTQEELSYKCTITENRPFFLVFYNDDDNILYQEVLEKINSLEYIVKVENKQNTLQLLDLYYITKNVIERKSNKLSI